MTTPPHGTARGLRFLAGALLLAGCATSNSLQPGSGGKFAIRGYSYDEVFRAATGVLYRDFMITDLDRSRGVIRADSHSATSAPGGGMVGVFITPPDRPSDEYTVEIKSLNKYGVQVAGEDWEKTLRERIQDELPAK
ncbi:MAG: hypothetical protein NTV79_08355 [Candidatus Aureabacteria bacterium]|nr:hypothetical protein [Candidatus Auribacterota bacterium]